MATVNAASKDFADCRAVTWGPLTTTNVDGSPVGFMGSADKSIQVTGTWGAGGTLVFQGSNDGTTWFTLNDLQTVALSKTANFLEGVAESTLYVRPLVTAGDGTTSLTAVMVVRQK